jgi:hypothetical protein
LLLLLLLLLGNRVGVLAKVRAPMGVVIMIMECWGMVLL